MTRYAYHEEGNEGAVVCLNAMIFHGVIDIRSPLSVPSSRMRLQQSIEGVASRQDTCVTDTYTRQWGCCQWCEHCMAFSSSVRTCVTKCTAASYTAKLHSDKTCWEPHIQQDILAQSDVLLGPPPVLCRAHPALAFPKRYVTALCFQRCVCTQSTSIDPHVPSSS